MGIKAETMSDLRAKHEAVLEAQLDKIDETVPYGKDGKVEPLYPAKERVALLAEVRQYLAESKEGPEYGAKLRGGGDR